MTRRFDGYAQWCHWLWTLGVDTQGLAVRQAYERLLSAWESPTRAYHNIGHLKACLTLVQEWAPAARLSPSEEALLGLAVWFHDAVYDPRRSDNEAQSAAMAMSWLGELGLSHGTAERVSELVMATAHLAEPSGGSDGAEAEGIDKAGSPEGDGLPAHLVDLLLDIDLAVLGASKEAFAEYEAGVQQEYAWVAPLHYAQGRAAVLAAFLPRALGGKSSRETVYRSECALSREAVARHNLRTAIAHWGSRALDLAGLSDRA